MNTQIVPKLETTPLSKDIEEVLLKGDLSRLTTEQRIAYYHHTCHSLGLNPNTRPFEYIELPTPGGQRKLFLYAKKDATDQLRKLHGVSIEIIAREHLDELYVVTARAFTKDDRCDESIGAVSLSGFNRTTNKAFQLSGDAKANALMKAETKAKRRATLSICGLGMLDESELESIPGIKIGEDTNEKKQSHEGGDIKTNQSQKEVRSQISQDASEDSGSICHTNVPITSKSDDGSDRNNENAITEKQRKRLFAISKASHWGDEDVRNYIKQKFDIDSTKDLDWLNYASVCKYIESNPMEAK